MKAASEWVFTGDSSPTALLSFFDTNFQVTAKASAVLCFASAHWILPCVFLLKCESSNGVGFVMPLTCVPQFKVSELRLLLTLLSEGFVHQSDLLLAWISTRDNFCCSSFWETEVSVSLFWIIWSHPLVTICLTWYRYTLAMKVS